MKLSPRLRPQAFRFLSALLACLAAAVEVNALVIDSFDTPQFVSRAGVGSASGTADLTVGDLLGSERDVVVTVTTGGGTLSADADMSLLSGFSHLAAGLVEGTTLITYDGNDDDATTLDAIGLGGIDVSNGGQDGTFYVVVPFSDHGASIAITVYSDSSSCSVLSRAIPAGLTAGDFPIALIFPFSEFAVGGGCGAGADFMSVGAITLLIDGTALGAIDTSLSTFATGSADLGDLPASYDNTVLADDGAAHEICPGLKLGAEIDSEADGQESNDATGDDTAALDDEDGVVLTPAFVWSVGASPGNGGRLDITVMGDGCLSGWIDWSADGDFDDTDENVLDNVVVSAGTATYSFSIPGGTALPGTYFARFRLFARDMPGDECTSLKAPTGQYECGEVEDYELVIEIPTPTPTLTPTITQTATMTPTSTPVPVCGNDIMEVGEECDDGNLDDGDGCDSNCRITACGNGVVTEGEQCDDGNLINLDGCQDDCTPSPCTISGGSLVPGYCATRKNDCFHEFCSAVTPLQTDRFGGLPGMDVECVDDDPSCDFGTPGDNACTFRVALCYNVAESRFPCSTVGSIGFIRFRRANPRNAIDVANRDALEAAVIGIGGELRVGRGVPGRRAVFFDPPLADTNVCTDFAEFKVPLRGNAPRFRTRRKLLVTVADPPLNVSRAKRDSDVLRLICHPK